MESINGQRSRHRTTPAPTPQGEALASSALRRHVPRWLRWRVRTLVVVDAVAAISATLLSQILAFGREHAVLIVRHVEIPYSAAILAVVPTWLVLLAVSRAYDIEPFGTAPSEARQVINAGMRFLALMAVAYYVVHLEQLGRDFMIAIVPLATGLTLIGRAFARLELRFQRSRGHGVRRAILLGPRGNSAALMDHLAHHPGAGVAPVAALAPDAVGQLQANGMEVPILGKTEDAVEALRRTDADLLIVTGNLAPGQLRALTWTLEGTGIDVFVAPTVTQVASLLDVRPVAGLPLLYVDHASMRSHTANALASTALQLDLDPPGNGDAPSPSG